MRVLLVEDEPNIARFIKQGLEEERYAVDLAGDGEEALDWVEVAQYDLMILDILLPKRNGISTCSELRQRGIKTPVLMLTARDTVEDRVVGLDSGADDYLVKPFAFKELLARLRALARRLPEVQPTVLQFHDLRLDTTSHKVTRADRRIDLTPKESSLLEFLLRHPERVLSRAMIAEHVWDYDSYGESNIVDVYIRYLRRKLNEGGALNLIHTVRGAGYQLAITGDDQEI